MNQFNQLMNMSDRQNNKMSFDQQELHKQVLKRNRLAGNVYVDRSHMFFIFLTANKNIFI